MEIELFITIYEMAEFLARASLDSKRVVRIKLDLPPHEKIKRDSKIKPLEASTLETLINSIFTIVNKENKAKAK